MTTYNDLRKIRNLEVECNQLGFKLIQSKRQREMFAITPMGTEFDLDMTLPTFNREAEIAVGTVEDLDIFLHGWRMGVGYIRSLTPRYLNDGRLAEYTRNKAAAVVKGAEDREQKKVFDLLVGNGKTAVTTDDEINDNDTLA